MELVNAYLIYPPYNLLSSSLWPGSPDVLLVQTVPKYRMTYSLEELKQLAKVGVIFLGVFRGRQDKTLFFEKPEILLSIPLDFAKENDLDSIPLDESCYVIEGMAPNNRCYSITVYDTHGQKLMYLEEPLKQSCH